MRHQLSPLWLLTILVLVCALLCGCQGFLYPFITDETAIEDVRIEGKHQWQLDGIYEAVVTRTKKNVYKAAITSPYGKNDLLVRLTKIKDQLFFELTVFPIEPLGHPDESAGEGLPWAFLNAYTQRPTYLVGKVVSFEPHLRITFFNASGAAEKYFTKDMVDSYHAYPLQPGGSNSKPGALIVVPPDQLRAFIERAADDGQAFNDFGFAK